MNLRKRLSYFVTTLMILVLVGVLYGDASAHNVLGKAKEATGEGAKIAADKTENVGQDIVSGTKKVVSTTKKGTVKAGKVTYKTGRKVTSRSKKIGKSAYRYSKKGVKATASRTRKTVRTAVTGRSHKTRRP